MRMKGLYFGMAFLLALMLSGCGQEKHVEKSEILMDTVVQLSATGEEAEEAVAEGLARLHEIDRAAGEGEDSDAARLAAAAGTGEWVKLSPDVYHILVVSQAYSKKTGGAWDVTTGAATALWAIGRKGEHVPAEAERIEARAHTGWQKLELREDGSARLLEAGMKIDLGGIAKGYAADAVRKIYEAHRVKSGLINLGTSSIYAVGEKPDGTPFRVGIRDPRGADAKAMLAAVPLKDAALSSSGDYERFFEQDGVRYHHIMDPATCAPARSGVTGVAVRVDGGEPDAGLRSDLLATALFIMGYVRGMDFLAGETGTEGLFVDERGEVYATDGIRSQME